VWGSRRGVWGLGGRFEPKAQNLHVTVRKMFLTGSGWFFCLRINIFTYFCILLNPHDRMQVSIPKNKKVNQLFKYAQEEVS
jgi:hypothetical protein